MDAVNNNTDDIFNVHEIVNNVDEPLLVRIPPEAEASEQVGATVENIGMEESVETCTDIHAPQDNFLE